LVDVIFEQPYCRISKTLRRRTRENEKPRM